VSYPSPNPTTIAVTGGDPLVGQALEVPLLNAGYRVRLLEEFSMNGEANPLDGVDLLLLTPRSGDDDRTAILSRLQSSTPASSAKVPVVELVAGSDEARAEEEVRRVLWPCRMKDLRREIEAVLSNDA
jgi:nucleoside-diphosphate-sugar epimerase